MTEASKTTAIKVLHEVLRQHDSNVAGWCRACAPGGTVKWPCEVVQWATSSADAIAEADRLGAVKALRYIAGESKAEVLRYADELEAGKYDL